MDNIFQSQSTDQRAMDLFQSMVNPSTDIPQVAEIGYDELPALQHFDQETERLEESNFNQNIFQPFQEQKPEALVEQEIFNPIEIFKPTIAPPRQREGVSQSRSSGSPSRSSAPAKGGIVTAQVTRYGFKGDSYQNHTATSKGSDHENIGNRSNILKDGVSVALPPKTARALGINLKAGQFVEAKIKGRWQRFRVDDTTANHKNHRIDFYDPRGKRVKIDGSNVQLRKSK